MLCSSRALPLATTIPSLPPHFPPHLALLEQGPALSLQLRLQVLNLGLEEQTRLYTGEGGGRGGEGRGGTDASVYRGRRLEEVRLLSEEGNTF